MKMSLFVALLVLILPATWQPAAANNDLLLSRWAEDAVLLYENVFMPMNKEYESRDDDPRWYVYSTDLLDRVRPMRGDVQPYSYQIVRQLVLSLSETFSGEPEKFGWKEAARYMEIHMHYTGSIIGIVIDELDQF